MVSLRYNLCSQFFGGKLIINHFPKSDTKMAISENFLLLIIFYCALQFIKSFYIEKLLDLHKHP